MISDKKGFLLAEETLKMVVAVICIVFLVFFLTSLYFSKINEEKVKHAKSVLEESDESIKNVISSLNEGDSKRVNVFNPDGWYLLSFTGDKEKPNSCAGKNCLCICDKILSVNFWSSQAGKCGEDGACIVVDELRDFESIKIKNELTFIMIEKKGGKILVSEGAE
jgi:hypothetical protein